jgi:hypothetical protein
VQFLQRRQRDDTGRVFVWDGRVFRAILPEKEDHVRRMFSSGFLDRLVAEGCFPRTWISDVQLEGYPLVLEHAAIWPVTYPQDWTFSMLKQAALVVCRTARIAKQFGYNMRDCHGLNVLFDGSQPKFIDLGSFVPDESLGWRPYDEFLRFYDYPLHLWQYNSFVGKLSIFSGNLVRHEDYWRSQHPVLRRARSGIVERLIGWSLKAASVAVTPAARVGQLPRTNRVLHQLMTRGLLKTEAVDLTRLERRISRLEQRRAHSAWGTYHEGDSDKATRFNRIVEIVNGLGGGVRTAVDFGGNQGKFSRLLVDQAGFERVVCVDADENAIDAGYRSSLARRDGAVSFVHYDCMGGIAKLRFQLPEERLRADLVVALALTHHLLLAQGYDVDFVLETLSAYATQYVAVEFMPLGLWVKGQTARTPPWYTRDWFRESFSKHFEPVVEEELRENNVLFVGRVRRTPSGASGR